MIEVSTSTIFFANSTVYNITGLPNSLAGLIVADSSKVYIFNTTFYSINADVNGLILSQLSTVSLTTTNVSLIKVTGESGVIQSSLGKLDLIKSYFGYNTAGGQNIISVVLGNLLVNESKFENNTAGSITNNIFLKKGSDMSYIVASEFTGRSTYQILSDDQIIAEFVYVIMSSITLDDVKFRHTAAKSGAMHIEATSYIITMNNLKVYNNIATQGVITLFCKFTISNSVFRENSYPIYAETISSEFSNVSFINNDQVALQVICTSASQTSIVFEDLLFDGYPNHDLWGLSNDSLEERTSTGIYMQGCSGVVIKNSVFRNLVRSSGNGAGVYIRTETYIPVKYTAQIIDSTFENLKADKGGAIYIENNAKGMSQVSIDNTTIKSCFATKYGGAIYYHNFPTSLKENIYKPIEGIDYLSLGEDTTITDSAAGEAGGAIYYSQLRPVINQTVNSKEVFVNNKAPYGHNWASYPVSVQFVENPDPSIWQKVVENNGFRVLESIDQAMRNALFYVEEQKNRPRMLGDKIEVPAFVSGQQMYPSLVFKVVDADGQVVSNWNKSVLSMNWKDNELKVLDSIKYEAKEGYFVLSPFVLRFIPGQTTEIIATTSFEQSSGSLSKTENLKISILANFRLCTNGEHRTDLGLCQICPAGKCLFAVNSKQECRDCPASMLCDGGQKVGPLEGYSRFTKWNERSVRCINDEACLGHTTNQSDTSGLYCKESYNSSFCLTGWCSAKYHGNMCEECTPGNAKSGIYCVSCSNNPAYYVLGVFVIIVAIGFIVFTVRNAIRVKDFTKEGKKPKTSILIKIFTNYFQLVSIVATFDFHWPDQVKGMFTVHTKVASSTSEVFSLDCLLPQGSQGNIRPFFTKLSFIVLSPIVLCIIAFLVWLIIFKMKILYRIQSWDSRDSSGPREASFLDKDMGVQCWEETHLFWIFAVVLPSFVFWGIGIPFFAYTILRNNRKLIEDIDFKSKFGFLYDGYKKERYFWYPFHINMPYFQREFIILYRKLIMVFISVFMVTYGLTIQALCVLGVSFLSYILQIKGKPFQEEDLNLMEKRALVTASITLYCGLYYVTNELPFFANILLLIIIFVCNIAFSVVWFLTLVKEYKKQFSNMFAKPQNETELAKLTFDHSEQKFSLQTPNYKKRHAEIDEVLPLALPNEDMPPSLR